MPAVEVQVFQKRESSIFFVDENIFSTMFVVMKSSLS